MADYLTSNYSSALKQRLIEMMKLNNKDDLTEAEVTDAAKAVVESEGGNPEDVKKMNLDEILSDIENGHYNAVLEGGLSQTENVKGFDDNYPCVSKNLGDTLVKYGICKRNEKGEIQKGKDGNPVIYDYSIASKLVGQTVTSWDEFYDAIQNNSYSVKNGEISLPSYYKQKYLVGPTISYGRNQNGDKVATDNFYSLNYIEIEKDFPGQIIKTIEDLVKAIEASPPQDVNGEIDEWFNQGGTGDCWLLSGVLSLASTPEGKQIIKDAIKLIKDEKGNITGYEVTFKGALDNKGNPVTIKISADELNRFDTDANADDAFSNGDNDMLLLELAVNKLEEMLRYGQASLSNSVSSGALPGFSVYDDGFVDFVTGSHASRLVGMLTGVDSDLHITDLTRQNIYDLLLEKATNPDTVLSFGLYGGQDGMIHTAKRYESSDVYSFSLSANSGHAFAITDVKVTNGADGKPDPKKSTVTFLNPWDSTDKITVSWEEFYNLDVGIMMTTNLNGEGSNVAKDKLSDLSWIVEEFIKGNLTLQELEKDLNDIGIQIKSKSKDEHGNIVVTYMDGNKECRLVCNEAAVNDGVKGDNGTELPLFRLYNENIIADVSGNGNPSRYAQFTKEQISKYFIEAGSYQDQNGKEYKFYALNYDACPPGVSNPEELALYLKGYEDYPTLAPFDQMPDIGSILNLDNKSYTNYNDFLYDIFNAFGWDIYEDNWQMAVITQSGNSYVIGIGYTDEDGKYYEVAVTVQMTAENEYSLMQDFGLETEFSDLLSVVDEKYAVEVLQALKDAKAGDVNALLDLEYNGFDLHDAVQKEDGTFDVEISQGGKSYTFNFSADKKAALMELDLLIDDGAPKSSKTSESNVPDTDIRTSLGNKSPSKDILTKFQFISRYE